jgi:tetratricopeptide (TPR) repeat protein
LAESPNLPLNRGVLPVLRKLKIYIRIQDFKWQSLKDTFHNLIFDIDNLAAFGTVNSTADESKMVLRMKRDFTRNMGQTPQFKKVEAGNSIRMLALIGLLLSLIVLLPNCGFPPSYFVDVKPSGMRFENKVPLNVGYYITAKFEKDNIFQKKFGYSSYTLNLRGPEQFKLALQQVFRRVETIWEAIPYTKNKAKELDAVIEPQIDKFYFSAPPFEWQTYRARITYKVTLCDSNWNVLFTRFVEGIGDTKGPYFWGGGYKNKNARVAVSKAVEEGVKNVMDTILTSEEIKKLLTSYSDHKDWSQPRPQFQASQQPANTFKDQIVSASEYNKRGFEYYKNNQYKQAIENFSIAISMENNSSYYINRGSSFYELKQYDNAILDFKQAIILAPNEAKSYGWCGNVYYAKKSYREALEYFSKPIAIAPSYAVFYLNRGYTQLKIGNKSTAASDFRKACELGNEDGCEQLKVLENK